jgi:polysaccharide export outer membrane protein
MSIQKLLLAGLICSTLMLTGCFSSKPEDLQAFLKPYQADVTMDEHIIEPPDEITVIAKDIPELRSSGQGIGQTQPVRADGMISFENIGEIPVAGKTPREVAEIISEKLTNLYKLQGDYPIDVRIKNQSSYYYVIGMVKLPGAKIFTGRETTLKAISRSVPTNLAWKSKVQVIRPSMDPAVPSKIFALNFKKMTEHGKMNQNVLLEAGDIIYVPPTILASIGLTIGEITNPVLQGGRAVQMFSPTP